MGSGVDEPRDRATICCFGRAGDFVGDPLPAFAPPAGGFWWSGGVGWVYDLDTPGPTQQARALRKGDRNAGLVAV